MSRTAWSGVGVVVVLLGTSALAVKTYPGRHVHVDEGPRYVPTATIKDLMDAVIDPSADDVWNAVKTTVSHKGTEEAAPVTAEEWAGVRRGAIRLIEGANLLMMPGRHVARPGEKSETPGVELEPQEMEALLNHNRALWNERATALRDVSTEVLHAAEAKDGAALFEVGGRLDTACENCHRQYWYPNEHIPDFPADTPERR